MRIAGYNPNSFVDFPGNIAAIVFVGGCNLRCWYCHNAEILDTKEFLSDVFCLTEWSSPAESRLFSPTFSISPGNSAP